VNSDLRSSEKNSSRIFANSRAGYRRVKPATVPSPTKDLKDIITEKRKEEKRRHTAEIPKVTVPQWFLENFGSIY
jgi:hypothetical protein